MAYEDLLEKLVLPTPSATPDESEAAEEPPPFAPARPSSSHPVASPWPISPIGAPSLADVSDERTVVTANPLLAEDRRLLPARRRTSSFQQHRWPRPCFMEPQVLAPPSREPAANRSGPEQVYPDLLPHVWVHDARRGLGRRRVLSRLMAPPRTVVTALPAQVPTLVARPVVPVPPAQPAKSCAAGVPLPTPTEPPVAAQPAAAARPGGPQPRLRGSSPHPKSLAWVNPSQGQE